MIKAGGVALLVKGIIGIVGAYIGFTGSALVGGSLTVLGIVVTVGVNVFFGDDIDKIVKSLMQFFASVFKNVEGALFA